MEDVRLIKPYQREVEIASGSMTRIAGVSEGLVGATGIHLAVATIPPGMSSSPHIHLNCEAALYVLKGRGTFYHGDMLGKSWEFAPGDYLFVPPGTPHQPVNDGEETIELIVARNTPTEIVEEYPPDPQRS